MQPVREPRKTDGAEAKVALLEVLLACDEWAGCAQAVVDWIAQAGGVRRIICAVADDGEVPRLVGLAGHGIPASQVRAYVVRLDAGDDPVVRAVGVPRPTFVSLPNGAAQTTPLRAARFLALSLPLDAETEPVGLLLMTPPERGLPAVRWAAQALGQKLVRLREVQRLAGAERRQGRERALLQSVLNAVPDPILLTDTEGRLILANPRAELFFASQDGESEGRRRAVALNNMLFSAGLSRRALEGTEAVRRELPLVDPNDGSDRLFELISTVVVGPEGPGIVSVLRNVTDLQLAAQEIEENYTKLRIAEANVRAERDRLDLIIDSVADPILVTDPNGRIVLMNTPAERLFTAKEGDPIEVIHRVRANDAHFSSHISNLFLTPPGERWHGDLGLFEPRSGAAMPVEAISGKILTELGEVTGVVTILHDRTEALEKAKLYERLKRASDELEAKVREATSELVRRNELLQRQAIALEQASNLKSQFLATMSHEFRTPLNAILGYTSMLLKGVSGELNPHQRRNLMRVDSNARQLLSIINDILDISRIEAGKMPVNLTKFPLKELVAEVLAEVDPLVNRDKVVVISEFARALPPLYSDRPKVKQILVNLLSNALKFTPSGSVTISTAVHRRAKEIRIAVTDTGIGIAEADQESIFEDFRQADNSTTRQYSGAGLGLAICRRLANILGGKITLTSKVGQGSVFTLILPIRSRNP